MTYAEKTKALLNEQLTEWEQCAKGYESLKTVKVRSFKFDGIEIKVNFNSGRIISTSAKVDEKTITERKCFLCPQNLPPLQKGVQYNSGFQILVNPFPIFPEHFTIPSLEHKPQEILNSFPLFLELARDLAPNYTVFYNGPKCGASAPDHLHFQAGLRHYLPIETEIEHLKHKALRRTMETPGVTSYAIDDGLRKFVLIEADNIQALDNTFITVYAAFKYSQRARFEPLLNIISFYVPELSLWKVIMLLRSNHRPTQYFETGENRIMLSPASVDIGGVAIIPVEEDFLRVDEKIIKDIFSQVFVTRETLLGVL